MHRILFALLMVAEFYKARLATYHLEHAHCTPPRGLACLKQIHANGQSRELHEQDRGPLHQRRKKDLSGKCSENRGQLLEDQGVQGEYKEVPSTWLQGGSNPAHPSHPWQSLRHACPPISNGCTFLWYSVQHGDTQLSRHGPNTWTSTIIIKQLYWWSIAHPFSELYRP
ncbi:hypothetical protein V8B97DRAFT_288961 [Scleroderma yunnanense]